MTPALLALINALARSEVRDYLSLQAPPANDSSFADSKQVDSDPMQEAA